MSGGRRKEELPQPQLANGALRVSVWSKALRSDAAWDDKVRRGRRACGPGRTGPGVPRPARPAVGAGSGWPGGRRGADERGPGRPLGTRKRRARAGAGGAGGAVSSSAVFLGGVRS